MSYDVAVWIGNLPADNAAALETFKRRWKRYENTPEPTHPQIAAFLDDLLERYPDLDGVPESELESSPWAEGHMIGNARGRFFYFAMTYPGARKALQFVAETAAAHNLVCFDPQSSELL